MEIRMGFTVTSKDIEIWSPALMVGRLFLDQTRAIERAFGITSGVESPLADEIQIKEDEFDFFIQSALRRLAESNNGPFVALCSGWLQVAIALRARIFGEWPEVPASLEWLVSSASRVMQARETSS
jgi:hypothetical protein